MEIDGERNRCMYILKSRGMAHSNQIREFILTDQGIELVDVYVGPGGVLTGSARLEQEAEEQAAKLVHTGRRLNVAARTGAQATGAGSPGCRPAHGFENEKAEF
jgi:hypothetical protein